MANEIDFENLNKQCQNESVRLRNGTDGEATIADVAMALWAIAGGLYALSAAVENHAEIVSDSLDALGGKIEPLVVEIKGNETWPILVSQK